MKREALDLWGRALEALRVAQQTTELSPDACASRAYYAAFYAVSALFAAEGTTFSRHTAVEAAVHRELVKAGLWDPALGAAYTKLMKLRETGDYGGGRHVTAAEAEEAVLTAWSILRGVTTACPEVGFEAPAVRPPN